MLPTLAELDTIFTRSQSLQALGNTKQMQIQTKILDICIASQKHGAADLSGREIQRAYESHFSMVEGRTVRLDASTISSRINSLVAAGRLQRMPCRPCAVTGRNISPVRVPMAQVRLAP